MKKYVSLLASSLVLASSIYASSISAATYANNNQISNSLPGTVTVNETIVTAQSGIPVVLRGYATHPEQQITKYEWDFDNDGITDFESTTTGNASHTYNADGIYQAILKAYLEDGTLLPQGSVKVLVGDVVTPSTTAALTPTSTPAADGKEKHYVVILNGGAETRFWEDVEYLYSTLKDYGYSDEDIYFLNYDGLNPSGENPNGIIDYPALKEHLDTVFAELTAKVDADDILHIFVDDHGSGYIGPVQHEAKQQISYGYNAGVMSVDPGDEADYNESELKLRSVVNRGDFYANHEMNKWGVYSYSTNGTYYRQKYVGSFDNIYFEDTDETISDSDETIEVIKDYLLGDIDKNGKIEGDEVYDYDGDGIPPYDHNTGTFDEDDWGNINTYTETSNVTGYGVKPEGCAWDTKTLDIGLDNKIDLMCSDDGVNYRVIATDFDNDGYYDGVDVNDDGDLDDVVSIDETISLSSNRISDDEFADLVDMVGAGKITIVMEQCFSGGFIEDLTKENRVIFTATEEETVSWGNLFIRNMITSFSGVNYSGGTSTNPAQADINGDGTIDFAESFTFSAENDYYYEIPQYDDNGDGIPSAEILNGTEGIFGATITLQQKTFCEEFSSTNSEHETADRAYSETTIEGQTCYGTYCFGGTEVTTWYAQGSDENLGASGSTVTTLHTETEDIFAIGSCPTPDITAPVITISGDNPTLVYQGSEFVEPGATATDDRDGDITSNIVVSGYVNTDSIGQYILTYSVSDAAGNIAEATRVVHIIEVPACVEFTDTVTNHETADRAYSETTMEGQTCYGTFCFGGTEVTTWFAQGSDENLGTNGSATVTLISNPNGEGYVTGECPAEPQPPQIDSYDYHFSGNTLIVEGTASDADGDLIEVHLLNGPGGFICTGTENFVCEMPDLVEDTTYTVALQARDTAGNETITDAFSFTYVVGSAPTIDSLDWNLDGNTLTITGTASDVDGDLNRVLLSNGIGQQLCEGTATFVCTITVTTIGEYTFYVIADDVAGNTSEYVDPIIFTYQGQAPTIDSYQYSTDGLTITFTGTASDVDGDLDRVVMTLGAAGGVNCTGTATFTCSWTATEAGTYTIGLAAYDALDQVGSIPQIEITVQDQGECITDTNYNHVAAERAYVGGISNLYAYAVGSDDDLGLYGSIYYSTTTSLEETSAGVWTKVSSCP